MECRVTLTTKVFASYFAADWDDEETADESVDVAERDLLPEGDDLRVLRGRETAFPFEFPLPADAPPSCNTKHCEGSRWAKNPTCGEKRY